jgi:hypothetical protein
MVVLVGTVGVLAFAAIELVPLLISAIKVIVTIPAIHEILSVTCEQAVASVSSVEDVIAGSPDEVVFSAKATYLVIAMLAIQRVGFVGAFEQATLGAAG